MRLYDGIELIGKETHMKGTSNLRSVRPLWMLILLTGMMLVLSLAPATYASNPQKMTLSYDRVKQVLSVTITHPSTTPATHFIKEIIVSNNGKVVNKATYTKQPGDTFTYTFSLPKKGLGVVEVTAKCSVEGELTEAIIPFK